MHMFPFFLFSFFSVPFSLFLSFFPLEATFVLVSPLSFFSHGNFHGVCLRFISLFYSVLLVPSNSRFLLVDFSDFLRIYRHPTPGVEGKDGTLRK